MNWMIIRLDYAKFAGASRAQIEQFLFWGWEPFAGTEWHVWLKKTRPPVPSDKERDFLNNHQPIGWVDYHAED